MKRQWLHVNIIPLWNDIDIDPSCNRTNRPHEGCGEEWEGGDVVGLGLRLDD
jgi:hypothetical protein